MEYYDLKKNVVGSGRRYELSSHQVTNHQMHAYTTKRMHTHTHTHAHTHKHAQWQSFKPLHAETDSLSLSLSL